MMRGGGKQPTRKRKRDQLRLDEMFGADGEKVELGVLVSEPEEEEDKSDRSPRATTSVED